MAAVASQPPVRTPSGGTTDQIFQPLADCGNGNPAFYHQFFDDFDQAFAFSTGNTYTVSGTAETWAQTPGAGGLGVMTETTIDDIGQIQLVTASFTQNIAPKKLFFEQRIALNVPATSNFVIGLCNNGAAITAGTGAIAVTDGVYFYYVGATNVLILSQATGSTRTSVTIPTAAYSFNTANTTNDLAFYQTRLGDILAYVDTQLVGFIPQSNIGTTGNPQNAGAVARILTSAYTATTANLTPTLCLWAGATSSHTLTTDFWTFEQER